MCIPKCQGAAAVGGAVFGQWSADSSIGGAGTLAGSRGGAFGGSGTPGGSAGAGGRPCVGTTIGAKYDGGGGNEHAVGVPQLLWCSTEDRSKDNLEGTAPKFSKVVEDRPLAETGDAKDSVSIMRATGDALVLLLPSVLHEGDRSGSFPGTGKLSLGGSGLIGGSEGQPEWVLSEPSSWPLASDSGVAKEV